MSRYNERTVMVPIWVNVVVKLITFVVLVSSITYLSICSWALAEEVKIHKEKDTDHKHEHDSNTHFIVTLVCYGVSIATTFAQTLVSLGLLCNCHGDLRKNSFKWIVIQGILLVIIIVAYFVPFSINEKGDHVKFPIFVENTGDHFERKFEDFHPHNYKYSFTYSFVAHSSIVFVGSVVVGLVAGFGAKSGYQAVW